MGCLGHVTSVLWIDDSFENDNWMTHKFNRYLAESCWFRYLLKDALFESYPQIHFRSSLGTIGLKGLKWSSDCRVDALKNQVIFRRYRQERINGSWYRWVGIQGSVKTALVVYRLASLISPVWAQTWPSAPQTCSPTCLVSYWQLKTN